MDKTTALLSAARFASAVARLCLGPLMPLLTQELHFTQADKPTLLSAYSSGYILTQIGGGYLADQYGFAAVIASSVGISSLLLIWITLSTKSSTWTRVFFGLGLVAGPLFPAGSAAISAHVPPEQRAASAAFVDAAAAGGTTVAALAPAIAAYFGSWKFVYYFASAGLAAVAFGMLSLVSQRRKKQQSDDNSITNTDQNETLPSQPASTKKVLIGGAASTPIGALLSVAAVATYLCHSVDNFTKYSINAWAATMLTEKHNASPGWVGTILAIQEAVGVASRLLWANRRGSGTATFVQRGTKSAIAFGVQGLALFAAFTAPSSTSAGIMFVLSALAVGAHSVGFRPVYLEASPAHAGSVSGFGNTVASLASAAGPVLVGSARDWNQVGLFMIVANVVGVLASSMIARTHRSESQVVLKAS